MNPFADMTRKEAAIFMVGKQHPDYRRHLASLVGSGTILDIGCGKGFLVKDLYSKNQYTGVDCSTALLELAAAENPGYRFLVANALCLPFRDKEFDVALLVSVLEHQPDVSHATRIYDEALRVASRVIVGWHTPPVDGQPVQRIVQAELSIPIPQNTYEEHHFARDGVCVKHGRFGRFVTWEASPSRGFCATDESHGACHCRQNSG